MTSRIVVLSWRRLPKLLTASLATGLLVLGGVASAASAAPAPPAAVISINPNPVALDQDGLACGTLSGANFSAPENNPAVIYLDGGIRLGMIGSGGAMFDGWIGPMENGGFSIYFCFGQYGFPQVNSGKHYLRAEYSGGPGFADTSFQVIDSPAVTLSSASINATDLARTGVRVTGSGFPSSDTITVTSGVMLLGSFGTDARGHFSANLVTGKLGVGQHPLTFTAHRQVLSAMTSLAVSLGVPIAKPQLAPTPAAVPIAAPPAVPVNSPEAAPVTGAEELANTGVNPAPALLGFALIMVGMGATLLSRRRRTIEG